MEVLKFVNNKKPKAISKRVAIKPIAGIISAGINGFNVFVYAIKFFQLPQAETSLDHKPKRSATADKKPILNDVLKNH